MNALRSVLLGSLLALACTGCSMFPYASQVKAIADQAAVTAIEDRQDYNDKKLAVSLAAVCDNSLGAVLRLENDRTRESLLAICGGDGHAVSAERLIGLLQAMDQLRSTTP